VDGLFEPVITWDYQVIYARKAIGRLFSPAEALDAATKRRDRTSDPALDDLFAAHGGSWFEWLEKMEPWDAVLDLQPEPHRTLNGFAWLTNQRPAGKATWFGVIGEDRVR
jgi:hypothetical protein